MDVGSLVKDGFEAYKGFMQIHPHIGNALTSEFILLSADLGSQFLKDKKWNPKKLLFTAKLAPFYSLGLEAIMESGNLVGEYILDNSLAKAALGPNLFGNIYNLFFFSNNTLGETHDYNFTKVMKSYYDVIKDKSISLIDKFKSGVWDYVPKNAYWIAFGATLTVWNVFQTFNYEYAPEELRAPLTLGASLFWSLGMTYYSLVGARNIAKKNTNKNLS